MDIIKPFIEKALYPAMSAFKGNNIIKYTNELKVFQNYTQTGIRYIQREKLKRLLKECINSVPAYSGVRMTCEEIDNNPFLSLLKFPVLKKSDFNKNYENYLNVKCEKKKLIPNLTGGSTSEPVRFFMDRFTVEHYEAARWRGLSWYGITPGSRSIMIWGNPIELEKAKQKKYLTREKWFKNRIIIPAYSLDPKKMSEYIKLIKNYKPEYIYGYSSALYAFCELLKKSGEAYPVKLKAVVSTAETLFDFQRELIKNTLCLNVVNEYGARDGGILAYECPEGGLHVSAENAYLEVIDVKNGKNIENGKTGTILITDLNNFSMPRLRYEIGDVGALGDKPCDCGMGLPLLKNIDGRKDDVFLTRDGHLIHGHIFNHIARSMSAINKFQIVQQSVSKATIKIINDSSQHNGDIKKFITEIKKLLPGAEIKVELTDKIPSTRSGKFRYAIRNFEL